MIAGLESPDDGEIWLDGRHVSAPRRIVVAPHARHIGFVFQDLALWPHMSVRGHLEFVLKAAGVSRQERVDRTGDVLTLVRIADMADGIRTSSRVVNSSASRWHGRWLADPPASAGRAAL